MLEVYLTCYGTTIHLNIFNPMSNENANRLIIYKGEIYKDSQFTISNSSFKTACNQVIDLFQWEE